MEAGNAVISQVARAELQAGLLCIQQDHPCAWDCGSHSSEGGPSPGWHSQPQAPRLGLSSKCRCLFVVGGAPLSLPFSLRPYCRDARRHPVPTLLPEGSLVLTVPSPQAPVGVLLSHLPFRPGNHQPASSPGFTLLLPSDLHHLAAADQHAPAERVSLPRRLQLRGAEELGYNPID